MDWFCNSKEAIEHKKTCTKNSWECGKCIWIDESSSAMSKYGTFVEKQPKKEKLIQSKEVISKFDNLAKKALNKDYQECEDPFLREVLRVFKK